MQSVMGILRTPGLCEKELLLNQVESVFNEPVISGPGVKNNAMSLDGILSENWTAQDWAESFQKDTAPEGGLSGTDEKKESDKAEITEKKDSFFSLLFFGITLYLGWTLFK